MKIVVGAATLAELKPLLDYFQIEQEDSLAISGHKINFLITGIGSTMTATTWLTNPVALEADFWLMLGIAGSYHKDWPLGNVLEIVEEQWGDLGVELVDGSFEDVFSLGLMERDTPPYQNAILANSDSYSNLPKAKGLTVHMTSGNQATIMQRVARYNADIESMEGAGFFHAALSARKKFCHIRSISNVVEPRDRSNWNIPLALENLKNTTRDILTSLPEL